MAVGLHNGRNAPSRATWTSLLARTAARLRAPAQTDAHGVPLRERLFDVLAPAGVLR